MTGFFHRSLHASKRMRATVSGWKPAAWGTMIRTGLSGDSAWAGLSPPHWQQKNAGPRSIAHLRREDFLRMSALLRSFDFHSASSWSALAICGDVVSRRVAGTGPARGGNVSDPRKQSVDVVQHDLVTRHPGMQVRMEESAATHVEKAQSCGDLDVTV
jgi:hypothetical protein